MVEPARVRLSERTLVNRINNRAFLVEQIRLNAAAEIRADFQIVILRLQPADGKLTGEKTLFVVIAGLALDFFKKFKVEIFNMSLEIVHLYAVCNKNAEKVQIFNKPRKFV